MKKVVPLIVIMALLGLGLLGHVYLARSGAGGTIFWKDNQAYLFLGTSQTGYRYSYFGYMVVLIRDYFNVPASPDTSTTSATVVHVSPSGVEKRDIFFGNEHAPSDLTPLEDGFYALCPGANLCKWTGTSFQVLGKNEQTQHLESELVKTDLNGETVTGWQVRSTGRIPGDHFQAVLKDMTVIDVTTTGHAPLGLSVLIRLMKPGIAAQTLYSANGEIRRITGAEYRQIFAQGDKSQATSN